MRRLNLLYLAGMLVIALGLMVVPKAGWAAYGDYLSTISTGSLNQPSKVAIDQANGDVYVTDSGSMAVKKFDKTGNYVSGFSLTVSGTPVGIAVNSTNIFVGDSTNKCVWIYNKSGVLADLSGTGTSHKLGGASGTSLRMPNTVTIAPSGHLFVVDGDSDLVRIYNADGSYNSFFGVSGSDLSSTTTIKLYYPSGLAMANSTGTGTVTQYFYLGDQGNSRVQKLSYTYDAITKAITAPVYVQMVGTLDATYTAKGDSFGKFLRISDVTWCTTKSSATPTAPGSLYVTDSLQMVVQRFENDAVVSTGAAFNFSGGAVSVPSQLNIPTGAAVDALNQKLYVANNQGASIAAYSTQNGTAPSLTISNPTALNTPVTASPYAIGYTAGDTDSTATLYLFLDNNSSWSGGNTSITPGTGEYAIGTASVAQGAAVPGSFNWKSINATPGTYYIRGIAVDPDGNSTEVYSAGTVVITDAGGGLNSIFMAAYSACLGSLNGPNDDKDADGLTNLQEQSYGTNPCVGDTDGGGINDGLEIAMGTDPLNPADDLLSAPSSVGVFYNIKPTENWKTWAAVKNTDPAQTATGQVTVFGAAGGSAITTKSFTVPPNGVTILNPADYPEVSPSVVVGDDGKDYYCISTASYISDATNRPVTGANAATYWTAIPGTTGKGSAWSSGVTYTPGTTTGSIEARIYGGRCVGYSTQEKWSTSTATACDFCYSCELGAPSDSGTTLYGSFWNQTVGQWDTWYTVKNVSSSSLVVSAYFYGTAGGTPVASKLNKTIQARGVWAFSPSAFVNVATYPKGSLKIVVVSGSGNIVGYGNQMFINQTNPLAYDQGYAVLLSTPNSLLTNTVAPHWSILRDTSLNVLADTWITMNNPAGTTYTTLGINYINDSGSSLEAASSTNIQPQASKAQSPEGRSFGWTVPTGSVEYSVTNGGTFIGYVNEFFYNTYNHTLTDVGFSAPLVPTPTGPVTLYAPYLRKGLDGWDTEMYLKNPNSNPVTADIYYYNMAGTQVYHDLIPTTVPAKGITTIKVKDVTGLTAQEVSVKIVPTGGGLMGFFCCKRNDPYTKNPDNSDMYEGAFGTNFLK